MNKFIFILLSVLFPLMCCAQGSFEDVKKAAEKGDAISQYNLGVYYYTGNGVEQDEEQATNWFEKAAEQGHEGAANALKELADKFLEQATGSQR